MSADYSLGPRRRVKKRSDFLRIQSVGKKLRSTHFLITFIRLIPEDKAPRPESRLGVTITTKVDKRAAARNRLRRRIREIFRKHRERLRFEIDLVVIALTGAADLSFAEIEQELLDLYQKAKIISA